MDWTRPHRPDRPVNTADDLRGIDTISLPLRFILPQDETQND